MLKEKIIKLRNEGKSYNEISKLLKCSKGTISYHCKSEGLNTPVDNENRKFLDNLSESDINDIKNYYKVNSNDDTIEKFDISIHLLSEITKGISKDTITDLKGYDRVKHFRHRTKLKAINYKGGECKLCGYSKSKRALSFHHIDETTKDFSISRNMNMAWSKLKKELDKCILVCSNCHMEIHDGFHDNNPALAKLVKAFG